MCSRIFIISLLFSQIFCQLDKEKDKNDFKLDLENGIIPSLLYYSILIVSCIVSLTTIFKKYTLEQYNVVEINQGDLSKPSETGKINENNNSIEEESNFKNMINGFSNIGKFLLTILSLDVIFFLYNLVVQAILLIPGLLYDMTYIGWRNFFVILYMIFTIFSSSILIIPTYEFFSFNFLRFKNPFIHLISFRYILNDEENHKYLLKKNKFINNSLSILGFIFILFYILGFRFTFSATIKDIIEIIVLSFIFIYYFAIILCYVFLSFYFIVDVFRFKPTFEKFEIKIFLILNSYFDKRNYSLPEINLISQIINPYLYKNYTLSDNVIKNSDNKEDISNEKDNLNKKIITKNDYYQITNNFYCKDNLNKIFIYLKLILIVLSIFGFWYILASDNKKDFSIIIFFIIYIIILILAFSINFPLNICTRKIKGFKIKPFNFLPFLIGVLLSYIISIVTFASFVWLTFFKEDIYKEKHNKFEKLNYTLINSSIYMRNKVFHSFCYSGVHNIPIYLYQTFINDAYYYNSSFTSFDYSDYKNLFFDKDYDIKVIGNLTNLQKKNSVKMIQYNVQNKRNNVTILSIKGTSYKRDIYLDAQLYFPSILLHILSVFSTIDQQKERYSFKFLEYGLSIPYRLFFQFSLVDDYLKELKKVYKYNLENNKFYENIVLVGHSLGGGLAKIFGKLIGK